MQLVGPPQKFNLIFWYFFMIRHLKNTYNPSFTLLPPTPILYRLEMIQIAKQRFPGQLVLYYILLPFIYLCIRICTQQCISKSKNFITIINF